MRRLILENICMEYDKNSKLKDAFNLKIDKLTINQGEFFTLIGESGCGKTTALRIIAGLEEASSGKLMLDEKDITYEKPERRGIGMVFQKSLLFPHMSVYENLAFALKVRKLDDKTIKSSINDILKEMDLDGYQGKFPSELSGGESQRVSLARSLLLEPEVLLMDEPFSALDVNTRLDMQRLIKKLHISRNMTIVFVTHDLEEAFSLSDRVAIVDNGSILQVDSPYDIYAKPNNEFVAAFVGVSNVYTLSQLATLLEKDDYNNLLSKYIKDENSKIGFRAKSISLNSKASIKDCKLVYSKFKGDVCSLHFEKNGLDIVVDSTNVNDRQFEVGHTTNLDIDFSEIVYIKE